MAKKSGVFTSSASHGFALKSAFQTRGSLDPIATFLETVVAPNLNNMRAQFYKTYLEIYASWASELESNREITDKDKCQLLATIADRELQRIASRYNRHFFLDILRTTPLKVLDLILGSLERAQTLEHLRIATLAIAQYSPAPSGGRSKIKGNWITATAKELANARRHLARDLAELLGASHAMAMEHTAFRRIGKGGRLDPAQPVPEEIFDIFNNFPTDIIILPAPHVTLSNEIEMAIQSYEERRDRQGRLHVAGIIEPRISIVLPQANWWKIRHTPNSLESLEISVHYLHYKDMIICSNSREAVLIDSSGSFFQLRPFAEALEANCGIGFDDFLSICNALSGFITLKTGYRELRQASSVSRPGLESTLRMPPKFLLERARALYSIFQKGLLFVKRHELENAIEESLPNSANPGKVAAQFLRRFTATKELFFAHSLEPRLFLDVDARHVVVDLDSMGEFFELCLRFCTSGGGEAANIRGKRFEDQSAEIILDGLGLRRESGRIWQGMRLKTKGIDFGDVDLAFIWNNLLINIDMKSRQKNKAYFLGESQTVVQRQKDLEEMMARTARRGNELFKRLSQSKDVPPQGVLTFLCVAAVEYIAPDRPTLWNGDIPRVLTPAELVELLNNPKLFGKLVTD